MDTQQLHITTDTPGIPAPLLDAVRRGLRTAFEILRSPRLPEQVILSGQALPEQWSAPSALPWLEERPRRSGESEPIYEYTPERIVLSLPAIRRAQHLGVRTGDETSLCSALAFAAGYAGALYASDAAERLGIQPDWALGTSFQASSESPGATKRQHAHQTARQVATIASGFTLVALSRGSDAQSEAVGFFLRRMGRIAAQEGRAALWRGALGLSSRALVREVRFASEEGRVCPEGQRLPRLDALLALIDHAEGCGPWPFAEVIA
jgi:hypothetical protein